MATETYTIPISNKIDFGRIVRSALGVSVFALVAAFFVCFLLWPVGFVMSKAFVGDSGLTLEYFRLLWENSLYMSAFGTSLLIGLCTTVLCIVVSLPIATINARYDYRGKTLISALLLLPIVMPPFVGAIGIQRLFSQYGSVNLWLLKYEVISDPIPWLDSENMFWVVVILEAMHLYPIMYLNIAASLANVDPSLEEAADLMGSSSLRKYSRIVWPLARPGLIAGALLVFIWAFTDLGTPLLIGFHNTIPVNIFNMVVDVNQNPVGFALVFVVIIVTSGIFLCSKFLTAGNKFQMMGRGHVAHDRKLSSLLVLIVWLFSLAIINFSLVPHLSVLLTSFSDDWFLTIWPTSFTLEHYAEVFDNPLALTGLKNSFLFAGLATFLNVGLGLGIAYTVVRRLVPFAWLLDVVVMLPLALPGVVLAFGYVITFTDTSLDPLANPVLLLIVAYSIRRLPYMVRSAAAGLEQTSVALEEAAATMGARSLQRITRITLPLVAANLVGGALLCFSYAMLDVSDSLILAMKDRFYPITKAIYSLYLEQGEGEYLAASLGMIAMAVLSACILGASAVLGKKMGELFKAG